MSGRIIFSVKLAYDCIVVVTFGRFVAARSGCFIAVRLDVTIKVSEAELDPWIATT